MSREHGQATVEFLGVVPAAVVALLVVWQLALAGQALWLAANAARVAARAQLVGGDPREAARSALPHGLEQGLEVERTRSGATNVRMAVPSVHEGWAGPLMVQATASLEAER
jgi:pilus assembly protein CpaE